MRMSDIVAAMDLTIFPLAGLAVFGTVFVVVSVRALFTSKRSCEAWSQIPLDAAPERTPGQEGA